MPERQHLLRLAQSAIAGLAGMVPPGREADAGAHVRTLQHTLVLLSEAMNRIRECQVSGERYANMRREVLRELGTDNPNQPF